MKHAPLFAAQFFAWVGMFALWVFLLPLISSLPGVAGVSGIRWAGLCLAFYVTLAAFIALALPRVTTRIGLGRTHAVSLLIGAAGLAVVAIGRSPVHVFAAFGAIAVGWASLSTLPYQIVSDGVTDGRYARAMGLFNFSSVVPQVAVALCLEPITTRLSPSQAIFGGAGAMALAGLISFAALTETSNRTGASNG